jgi:hypothetical protein
VPHVYLVHLDLASPPYFDWSGTYTCDLMPGQSGSPCYWTYYDYARDFRIDVGFSLGTYGVGNPSGWWLACYVYYPKESENVVNAFVKYLGTAGQLPNCWQSATLNRMHPPFYDYGGARVAAH